MIVTCNDEYWKYMESMKPESAPCGKTYDDVDHSTICPHKPLPGPLSDAEVDSMVAVVNGAEAVEGVCKECAGKIWRAVAGDDGVAPGSLSPWWHVDGPRPHDHDAVPVADEALHTSGSDT